MNSGTSYVPGIISRLGPGGTDRCAVGLQVAAEKLAVAETGLGSLTYSSHSKDVLEYPSYFLEKRTEKI